MEVQVPEHARSRHPTLVEAHVEAVRVIRGGQRARAGLDEGHRLRQLLGGGRLDRAHVAGDDGHEVPGGVRERVQDQEGPLAPAEDQRPAVVTGGQGRAEDARSFGAAGGRHVRHPPGRPEPLHSIYVLTSSRRRLPTLKKGTRFSGTLTLSPVFGLRPLREFRWRMRKLPKPRSSTLSPLPSASVMLSNTVFTMSSVSFLVKLATLATSSISSAFVMGDSLQRAGAEGLFDDETVTRRVKLCQASWVVRGHPRARLGR